jgi:hypothetical protein
MQKASGTPPQRSLAFRVLGLKGQPGVLTDDCPKAIGQFVCEVAGVIKDGIKISIAKEDCLKNAIVVPYDASKANPAAIARPLLQYWEVRWYECPCGFTAPEPGRC